MYKPIIFINPNWKKSPYKGILKVLVLPPKNLAVAVLPVKFDGN
jgi:hypothetical protein